MQYNKPESDSQLLKLLIIGNSGVGKSCMLMRYVENNFTTAFYNTIGVDFKMKNIDLEGKKLRLQIVDNLQISGTLLDKIALGPSHRHTTREHMALLLSMMSRIANLLMEFDFGCKKLISMRAKVLINWWWVTNQIKLTNAKLLLMRDTK